MEIVDGVDLLQIDYEENISSQVYSEYELYKKMKEIDSVEFTAKELRDMWMMIALEECVEFVISRFKQFNIACDYSDINKSTIKELLNFISVSQFYYLFEKVFTAYARKAYIWKLTSISLEEQIMGEILVEIKQSPKTIPKGDKSIYERSTISRLFFTKVLKIHDKGFYECPNIYCWNSGVEK